MLEILPDEPVKAGEIVAHRYRLDRIVGEGGMGVVWAATHVLTEKTCALKFLKASRASDRRSHARLLNEARATCRVRHPNVAPVHDILELPNGVPFIVMDLLDGEPLSAKLRRVGSLDWQATLEIVIPTVEAITAAHAQGVVHRDLKPDNVFLEKRAHDGFEVKVLDFGIAKRFDLERDLTFVETRDGPSSSSSSSLTTTHSALGTPSYMAPEQMRHDDDVGMAVDVWMLGMLVYECLTGKRPERDPATFGIADDVAESFLAAHARGANDAAIALVLSMLRLDPEKRPALANLRVELRDLRPSSPLPARSNRTTAVFAMIALVAVGTGLLLARRNDAHADPAVSTTTENQSIAVANASPSSSALAVMPSVETSAPAASAAPTTPKRLKKSAHVISPSLSVEPSPPPVPPASVAIPSYERQ